MIKKMAAVEITLPELYDKDGYPIEKGVMDPRLGVIDPGMRCRTCGGGVGTCYGHFGYLEIAQPVIHVKHVKTIYSVLRSTCEKCGRALVKKGEVTVIDTGYEGGEDAGEGSAGGEKETAFSAVKKKCPHCGSEQAKVRMNKPYDYMLGGKKLNPVEIREWLERIPDKDLKVLGIEGGRPDWLILTVLPVPPVSMRPSITLETGERSEDDLTHKLVDLVRINQRLRDNVEIGAPDFIIEDLWELLQYHVATLFDNGLSGVPQARHRSGRALRTLAQRLKGKEGRFRGNLTGKRVNFSARTVVSPDPNLSINEVGVPQVIARELTMPIRVNDMNIEQMKKIVRIGPEHLGGANYIIRPDGKKKKVTEDNKEEIANEVQSGFIIERHLQDGDIVIFNRQPSLHRMSIMAHRVRIMPYKTFRFNLSVCAPYNADFDGDEMNLHVPQTEEAQTEASELMMVENHIRSPRFGGPIIGCIQDHISGNYMLTLDNTIVPKARAIQLLAALGIEEEIEKDISGKELFSYLLPKGLNMKFKSNDGKVVIIKDGRLVQGVIDKKAIGTEVGVLIGKIDKEFGKEISREFIDRIGKLGIRYLDIIGFTIGISDEDIKSDSMKEIKSQIKDVEKECENIISSYRKGSIEILPGQTVEESLETFIMTELRKVLDKTSKIIDRSLPANCAVIMARSGARGSMINLTQLAGCVGQQTLQGKRIHRGYTERTLPHFAKDTLSPSAHGFVASSFKEGLTPIEFFFNAMNGREGLMDKSLRTRHSGYMERRLVNALQDLKVEYDGTVRNNKRVIVQFAPGEDGIDPAKSEWGSLDVDGIIESHIESLKGDKE